MGVSVKVGHSLARALQVGVEGGQCLLSLVYTRTCTPTRTFTDTLTRTLSHSHTHSLTHSLTHLLEHCRSGSKGDSAFFRWIDVDCFLVNFVICFLILPHPSRVRLGVRVKVRLRV